MKIVSACLIGVNCNYKKENKLNQKLFEEFSKGELLPLCPEILGGLPLPSAPAEIRYGTGLDVICGKARVIDKYGKDVTEYFLIGAHQALRVAKAIGATEAILKSKSPSCGCGKIYDGKFFNNLIDGDGVTAALLKRNGIKVYTEENFR